MNTISDLRPGARSLAELTRFVRVLIDQVEIYRRYISAGSEIETLLSLSDQQLAERGLTRSAIGRAMLEKYGIALDPPLASDREPTQSNV